MMKIIVLQKESSIPLNLFQYRDSKVSGIMYCIQNILIICIIT